MVFTALSSFNGVGINTLRTFFKQFFYILPCVHFLFIYFILFFVPFHLRVGSDCLISHQ